MTHNEIPHTKAVIQNTSGKAGTPGMALLSILAAACFFLAPAQVRVAELGSNPLLSAELFPQDMKDWPIGGLTYTPTYAKLPFWGRVDDPLSRPNGNYTSTGLTTDGFSHTAKIFSLTNGVSYTQRLSPNSFALAGLDLDLDARYNGAEGVLHSKDSTNSIIGSPVPFDYSMLHALGKGKITGAGAFNAWGLPMGVRLQFGVTNTAVLDQSLQFTKDKTYTSDRATWGWTTSPCAHVFGLSRPEGDTWLQDGYAIGPLYAFDLRAGLTLPFGKTGVRFSTLTGHQDYYHWRADSARFSPVSADSTINKNFIGHYEKQEWSQTTSGIGTQLYTNYTLRSHDRFALSLFGRVGYNHLVSGEALSENPDIESDSKESQNGVSMDIAPNLTIPFGSLFNYIDIAVPVQYGYTRKNNTYMRWVGGGRIKTYWDTRTSNDDEYVWEPYSYANMHNVNIGVDFSTMFPLFSGPTAQLGLGIQLLVNAGATFTGKSYGSNTDNGSSVDFEVTKKRNDYEGRKQFATGIKLQYQGASSMGWFEISEPLLQAVRPVTTVTDASGNTVLYRREKAPLWLSMQGIRFNVYYTWQMMIPWLARFNEK